MDSSTPAHPASGEHPPYCNQALLRKIGPESYLSAGAEKFSEALTRSDAITAAALLSHMPGLLCARGSACGYSWLCWASQDPSMAEILRALAQAEDRPEQFAQAALWAVKFDNPCALVELAPKLPAGKESLLEECFASRSPECAAWICSYAPGAAPPPDVLLRWPALRAGALASLQAGCPQKPMAEAPQSCSSQKLQALALWLDLHAQQNSGAAAAESRRPGRL